jgi:MarR family transcriptional regulator, negative regulator of the multidrug operon emrRAB
MTHTNDDLEPLNVANLLGALATLISDNIHEAMAHTQIGIGDCAALALLLKYPDCSIEDLRQPLQLSHSGCVRLVDRLVSSGYVERRTGGDKREVALRLTRHGRELARALGEERAASIMQLISLLSEEERSMLARIAMKMLDFGTPTPNVAGKTCRLCDYEACVECPVKTKFAEAN